MLRFGDHNYITTMKKIIGAFIVLVILITSVAYYIVLGIGPKDLEIKITEADSTQARAKVGTQIIPIENNSKPDFTLEGKKDAEFSMDSKELTAHSNNRPWKNYPVKNLQIKINSDGTVESSGILLISKAMPYAMGLGYSETQIREAMQKYNIPSFEVPIYVKGKGSVIDDKVNVDASLVKIGAVNIPNGIVGQANKEASKVLEDVIKKHSQSFHAEKLTFENGKMNFKGYVAEKEYVITN